MLASFLSDGLWLRDFWRPRSVDLLADTFTRGFACCGVSWTSRMNVFIAINLVDLLSGLSLCFHA